MTEHPIRKEAVNTWCDGTRFDNYRWLAKFGEGQRFPICFNAGTEDDVRAKAEAFRAETIVRNEATYQARAAAMEKARAARAKGKRAVSA